MVARVAGRLPEGVSDAIAIVEAGIRAANPVRAIRRSVRRTAQGFFVGLHAIKLAPGGRTHVVAIGKAAGAMADAAWQVLRGRTEGLAVVPAGYPSPRSGAETVEGDHPIPGPKSFRAGARVLDYVAATAEEDGILFLVSGGGSASLELPPDDLPTEALVLAYAALLRSGAPIGEMNTVRRHLSAIKGGWLARAVRAGRFATLAISDVVGDLAFEISSGPTVADPTTFRDALRVVQRRSLARRLPPVVLRHLKGGRAGDIPETPKPGDPVFVGRPFHLAATNRVALDAAALEASRRGFVPRILSSRVTGETRSAGLIFGRKVAAEELKGARRALLSGGETTVTMGRAAGHGGRNQEFALAAARAIRGRRAVVFSAGTDGIDGPTDAAGGWVNGETAEQARSAGVALDSVLLRHDSYDALRRLGGLWKPGPTGTNVMDLHVGLVVRGSPIRFRRGREGSSPRGGAPSSRRRRS
jgi:glycerate 2-kinase